MYVSVNMYHNFIWNFLFKIIFIYKKQSILNIHNNVNIFNSFDFTIHFVRMHLSIYKNEIELINIQNANFFRQNIFL